MLDITVDIRHGFADAFLDAIVDAVEEVTGDVEDTMRTLVPSDSGNLHARLTSQVDGYTGLIGFDDSGGSKSAKTDPYYWTFVAHGSKRHAGSHFDTAATMVHEARLGPLVAEAFNRSVR